MYHADRNEAIGFYGTEDNIRDRVIYDKEQEEFLVTQDHYSRLCWTN